MLLNKLVFFRYEKIFQKIQNLEFHQSIPFNLPRIQPLLDLLLFLPHLNKADIIRSSGERLPNIEAFSKYL